MKNYNVKITKKQQINYINNDMTTNFYFLVYGRIYNQNKTRYKKFKFVIWFDAFEIQEYTNNKPYTKKDINDFLDDLIFSNISYIKDYNNLNDFYNLCNESIIKYNKTFSNYSRI